MWRSIEAAGRFGKNEVSDLDLSDSILDISARMSNSLVVCSSARIT